jgi:phage-related protein
LEAGYFTVNGRKSEDINLFIEDRPDIQTPKRRVSFVSPVSYEGELVYDDDGYEPTEFELKCFYDGSSHGDDFAKLSEARNNINSLFGHGKGEWMSFVPYFDEEHSYQVIMMEIKFENKSYYEGCMSVIIKLKCQPYKYLVDNETKEISNGGSIKNPTNYNALPTIRFNGVKGGIVLRVGYGTMSFKSLNNETVFIDSQTFSTFSKDVNGYRNLNDRTIGREFFYLVPGLNNIYFQRPAADTTSTLPESIFITPNWRVLV